MSNNISNMIYSQKPGSILFPSVNPSISNCTNFSSHIPSKPVATSLAVPHLRTDADSDKNRLMINSNNNNFSGILSKPSNLDFFQIIGQKNSKI